MTFFTQLKCAFCPRRSCHARYKVGNRTYYSYLGFVSTQCPKKYEKNPFLQYARRLNERLTEEKLKRKRNKKSLIMIKTRNNSSFLHCILHYGIYKDSKNMTCSNING